jgi:hypothetical protein
MKHLSPNEKKWLNDRFPKLELNETEKGFTLKGDFTVDMFYDASISGGSIVFPTEEKQRASDEYIYDVYQILIDYHDALFIPEVYETGGRIKAFAERKKVYLADLHINGRGNLCLCPKPLEKVLLNESYTIQDFFVRLVMPFFYAQRYYEKFNKWPWKDYSHGDPGILECYADHIAKVLDKRTFIESTVISLNSQNQSVVRSGEQITRQTLCFCGSGNKFRNCHHEAWEAAKKFKEAVRSLNN